MSWTSLQTDPEFQPAVPKWWSGTKTPRVVTELKEEVIWRKAKAIHESSLVYTLFVYFQFFWYISFSRVEQTRFSNGSTRSVFFPSQSRCHPRFGKAMAAIRSKYQKAHRRQALSWLKAAKKDKSRKVDCRPMINKAWVASAKLEPVYQFLSM